MTSARHELLAISDIARQLLDEWGFTPQQIENIAKDLPRECAGLADERAEAAYVQRQQDLMESGGPDNSAYRRDMVAAGRGHLLGAAR